MSSLSTFLVSEFTSYSTKYANSSGSRKPASVPSASKVLVGLLSTKKSSSGGKGKKKKDDEVEDVADVGEEEGEIVKNTFIRFLDLALAAEKSGGEVRNTEHTKTERAEQKNTDTKKQNTNHKNHDTHPVRHGNNNSLNQCLFPSLAIWHRPFHPQRPNPHSPLGGKSPVPAIHYPLGDHPIPLRPWSTSRRIGLVDERRDLRSIPPRSVRSRRRPRMGRIPGDPLGLLP